MRTSAVDELVLLEFLNAAYASCVYLLQAGSLCYYEEKPEGQVKFDFPK